MDRPSGGVPLSRSAAGLENSTLPSGSAISTPSVICSSIAASLAWSDSSRETWKSNVALSAATALVSASSPGTSVGSAGTGVVPAAARRTERAYSSTLLRSCK
jgi:hypothetical protein